MYGSKNFDLLPDLKIRLTILLAQYLAIFSHTQWSSSDKVHPLSIRDASFEHNTAGIRSLSCFGVPSPSNARHFFKTCTRVKLSGKYADTINSEAKTSNNMELLLFVLSFQSVNSVIKYWTFVCSGVLGTEHCAHIHEVFGYYHIFLRCNFNLNMSL